MSNFHLYPFLGPSLNSKLFFTFMGFPLKAIEIHLLCYFTHSWHGGGVFFKKVNKVVSVMLKMQSPSPQVDFKISFSSLRRAANCSQSLVFPVDFISIAFNLILNASIKNCSFYQIWHILSNEDCIVNQLNDKSKKNWIIG